MTIDETIRNERILSRIGENAIPYQANYHKQIAEWLEELKELRKFKQQVAKNEQLKVGGKNESKRLSESGEKD